MIRVGIVDDQPLVLGGFAMLVDSQPDLEVVFQARDAAEIPDAARTPTDVVLMDINLPDIDGLTATAELLASDAHVRVIMLTTFSNSAFVRRAISIGASGFLLKHAEPEELLAAIREVADGETVLAPLLDARIIREMGPRAESAQHADDLTTREGEILRLIALGLSNPEIAQKEFISLPTVKTHVRHILMKTGSRDRIQAVLYAIRHGLVDTEELLTHPADRACFSQFQPWG